MWLLTLFDLAFKICPQVFVVIDTRENGVLEFMLSSYIYIYVYMENDGIITQPWRQSFSFETFANQNGGPIFCERSVLGVLDMEWIPTKIKLHVKDKALNIILAIKLIILSWTLILIMCIYTVSLNLIFFLLK